ncbi:MAG: proteobacterial dedicated sortase system histidine kinase [Aestuariibacter sp.]
MRVGIRFKLLILSLFLFTIPWLGYQYVWELESYLRLGQEQTMVGTARAVATALHERPKLFDKQASYLKDVKPGTDLYAHKIIDPIKLDGELSDWLDYRHHAVQYDEQYLLYSTREYQTHDLHFEHMVGIYKNYLYAYFEVIDDKVIMRAPNALRVDRNDYLYIALTDHNNRFHRYIIAPRTSGWVNAYELYPNVESLRPMNVESRIQGHWEITETGYNIELRMPLAMMADKIAFMVADTDSAANPDTQLRIGTADPDRPDSLGTVLVPSPEIEQIVRGLQHSGARVWVVDKHKRVMARSGSIQSSTGLTARMDNGTTENWWDYIEEHYLLPMYYQILTRPPANFIDDLQDAFALQGQEIDKALGGEASTLWRLSPDNKAVILSAAHPIWLDDKVMGAVIVEQTTHGIRTLRNKALEKLFNVILLVMFLGTLALFLFASRISFRIRKLRDQTEQAIDDQGRIVSSIEPSQDYDEIGDLSRTFHQVLEKLKQYHNYLENMASRLSHELRTPVAVVKSSLEMLQLNHPAELDTPYLDRAQEGVKRLSLILNNMSEASRLEQALKSTDKESFELNALVRSCLQGYQLAYPDRHFIAELSDTKKVLNGSPELFVQMLDKIIANAVDFSPENSDIKFALRNNGNHCYLHIDNIGPLLSHEMQSQLFDSMISVRTSQHQNEPHLGLGLFIARIIAEYHGASISIKNREENDGVRVTIGFATA